MATFQASRIKLRRARRHIAELEQVLVPFFEANPKITPHSVPSERLETVAISFDSVPEEVPAIIGDIIHNARSALDVMASQMAPDESRGSVYFPFANKKDDLNLMIKRRNFHLCGPDAVSLLKTLEPYKGGNTLLRAIHDMDVMDKHNDLTPNPRGNMRFHDLEVRTYRDGRRMIIPLENARAPSMDLVFDHPTGLGGRELISTLKEAVQLCEGIVEAFAALQAGDQPGTQPVPNAGT